MTNDELDLIETDALLDALRRRQGPTGAILFVSVNDRSDTCEQSRVLFRGGHVMALGMAVWAQRYLETKPPDSYSSE